MKKVFVIFFLAALVINLYAQNFKTVTIPNQIYGTWKAVIELPEEAAEEMLGSEISSNGCTKDIKLTLSLTIEKTKINGITAITNSSEITFILSSPSQFPDELISTFENRYKKKLYQFYSISADKKTIKIKTRKISEKFKYNDKDFFTTPVYISTDKKIMKMDFSGDGSNYIEFKRAQ